MLIDVSVPCSPMKEFKSQLIMLISKEPNMALQNP
jgi:hypothetical protein